MKHLVKSSRGKVIQRLEARLIDAVSDVGVDIVRCIQHTHYGAMLAFIPGLGLRKADKLIRTLRTRQSIDDRVSLKSLMGKIVWNNACGFIRFCPEHYDKTIDPLENTRIHPDCYAVHNFAQKLCADALEVECDPEHFVKIVKRLMSEVKEKLASRLKKHPEWTEQFKLGTPHTLCSFDASNSARKELSDDLAQLDLDEYAAGLEESGKGKRKLELELIKEELRFPWLDLRFPLVGLSPTELTRLLCNDTEHTLYVGLKTGCTVLKIIDETMFYERRSDYGSRRHKAVVKTDNGLTGYIDVHDISDDNIDVDGIRLEEIIPEGTYILAVIVGINYDKLLVDLSIKPSLLSKHESWWLENRNEIKDFRAAKWWEYQLKIYGKNPKALFDRSFDEKEALGHWKRYELQSAKVLEESSIANTTNALFTSERESNFKNTAGSLSKSRIVFHPLFANVDYKVAEEKLKTEGRGAGAAIVRPSSKGANFLTITWAFQENWFKHISVEECGNKSRDYGLATQLLIHDESATKPFSDLDELFHFYIRPMNELVEKMVSYKNFRRESPSDVEEEMRQLVRDQPGRIPYFVRFDPSKPGTFVLTWLKLNDGGAFVAKMIRILVTSSVSILNQNKF